MRKPWRLCIQFNGAVSFSSTLPKSTLGTRTFCQWAPPSSLPSAHESQHLLSSVHPSSPTDSLEHLSTASLVSPVAALAPRFRRPAHGRARICYHAWTRKG